MNQKTIVLVLALLFTGSLIAQDKRTIKVIVPNKTDEVYITGNQESLANWDPGTVKMNKISDYERAITVDLSYPAEFKFTKGDWSTEGIIKQLNDNPNQKIQTTTSKNIFTIKGWSNDIDREALGLSYDVTFVPSKYVVDGRQIKIALPKNYNPKNKYPVFYITDGASRNFEVAKNYLTSMASAPYEIIPETILVGIVHGSHNGKSNRNEDLDVYYGKSGNEFKDFLFEELIPYINESYSASGFNVMIGHSNGAELNHYLFLEKENPFRGFISISTNFFGKRKNKDVDIRMGKTMKNYEGSDFYYFVANATYDSPDRIQAGDEYEKMHKANANPKIQFKKNLYTRNHNSLVPESLFDGIRFVYKDYKLLEKYQTFYDYRDHYLSDMEKLYGIQTNYSLNDLENALMHIIETKNEKELDELHAFVEKNKLWQNPVMTEPGGFDEMNKGNFYMMTESYEKSAREYTKALDQLKITVEPAVYYYNFGNILRSFKNTEKYGELMVLLIKSRDKLINNPQLLGKGSKSLLLSLNYEIAKLSAEHNLAKKEGKKALIYCKDNYKKNKFFTEEELEAFR